MQDVPSTQSTSELIIAEAKKRIPDCDYICDLFDLSFIWASAHALEITGYSKEDVANMRNIDVLDDSYDEKEYRKELIERIARGKGQSEFLIKHKSGSKLKVTLDYEVFEYNDGWFLVGKLTDFKAVDQQQ